MFFAETMIEIEESVRGRDVYIIQTGARFVKLSSNLIIIFDFCQILDSELSGLIKLFVYTNSLIKHHYV